MQEKNSIIEKLRTLVKDEFNKAFEIKVNDNNYKIALSNDQIPIVKSYIKHENGFIIYFVDEPITKPEKSQKIFNVKEDFNGKVHSASIDYKILNEKSNFKIIRKEIQPLYTLQKTSNSITEQINIEKKLKLLHAIHEIIKKEKEYNQEDKSLVHFE